MYISSFMLCYTDLYSKVVECSLSNNMIVSFFKGLPGVDGREGIPGMPGAKVGYSWHAFNLYSFDTALDLFSHVAFYCATAHDFTHIWLLNKSSQPPVRNVFQLFVPEAKYSLSFDLRKLQATMFFRVNQEKPVLQVIQDLRVCQ